MSTQQKLIVVTGGAGFIGSHLCARLLAEGHRVISLDNYFTGSKENHVAGVEYREGHTKDIAKLIPENPDLIFHLGEYSRVEKSLEEPALVWDLNKDGTFGVVEFWREKKCKLVYAGSSTKFGDGGLGRVQSPYAWTKASNTELVANYATWYSLPYAITYFYNVYGAGERAGAYGTVIEIFRQKFLKNEPLGIVSPGTQKRNFTHVDDIIDGLVLVGEKGAGDEYGLGAQEAYSILDIAHMFGGDIIMLPERKGNRMEASLDVSKSRAIGWKQNHQLADYIDAIKASHSAK
jgi:UDP-glucose 4-epimerase